MSKLFERVVNIACDQVTAQKADAHVLNMLASAGEMPSGLYIAHIRGSLDQIGVKFRGPLYQDRDEKDGTQATYLNWINRFVRVCK